MPCTHQYRQQANACDADAKRAVHGQAEHHKETSSQEGEDTRDKKAAGLPANKLRADRRESNAPIDHLIDEPHAFDAFARACEPVADVYRTGRAEAFVAHLAYADRVDVTMLKALHVASPRNELAFVSALTTSAERPR
jgi:hypothetical protein